MPNCILAGVKANLGDNGALLATQRETGIPDALLGSGSSREPES